MTDRHTHKKKNKNVPEMKRSEHTFTAKGMKILLLSPDNNLVPSIISFIFKIVLFHAQEEYTDFEGEICGLGF